MVDVPILNIGYQVFGQWVGDILRSGHYRLHGTEHHPNFGTLYRFSMEKKRGILSRVTGQNGVEKQIRFWLAPKYGFLAVRSDTETKSPAGHQRLVYRMARAERRGSVWFPVAGSKEWYSIKGNKETLLSKYQLTVNRFELNKVPDSLFRPQLQAGYHINESETQRFWKVGANGEWIRLQPPARKNPSAMPIGWLFIASLSSLLVLAVGAFLRWRRCPAF